MEVSSIEAYYKAFIFDSCKEPERAKDLCQKLRNVDIKTEELFEVYRGWGALRMFFMPWKSSEITRQQTALFKKWNDIVQEIKETYVGKLH